MHDQNYSYYRRFLRIRKRDEILADKLMDFANLGAVALMFSQLSGGVDDTKVFLGRFLFL